MFSFSRSNRQSEHSQIDAQESISPLPVLNNGLAAQLLWKPIMFDVTTKWNTKAHYIRSWWNHGRKNLIVREHTFWEQNSRSTKKSLGVNRNAFVKTKNTRYVCNAIYLCACPEWREGVLSRLHQGDWGRSNQYRLAESQTLLRPTCLLRCQIQSKRQQSNLRK